MVYFFSWKSRNFIKTVCVLHASVVHSAADILRALFIFLAVILTGSALFSKFLKAYLSGNTAAGLIITTEHRFLRFWNRKTMTAFYGRTAVPHTARVLCNVQLILSGHGC